MPEEQTAFYEGHLVLWTAGEQLILFLLSFMESSVVFVSPNWWVNIFLENLSSFVPNDPFHLPLCSTAEVSLSISMATCEIQGWLKASAKDKEEIIFQTKDVHVAFNKISPWALAVKPAESNSCIPSREKTVLVWKGAILQKAHLIPLL